MYLTAFDLETVARLCSLFKKSCPPVRVCVDEQDSEREWQRKERESVCVTYFALQWSQAFFELCVVSDQMLCVFLLRSQGSLQRVLCGSQTRYVLLQVLHTVLSPFHLTHTHTQNRTVCTICTHNTTILLIKPIGLSGTCVYANTNNTRGILGGTFLPYYYVSDCMK